MYGYIYKTTNKTAWNKGLTKETDDRVRKYADARIERFNRGESIGCFGVKGNTNGFKKGNLPWNKGVNMSTHALSQVLKENDK